MLVSWDWLKQYVTMDKSVDDLTYGLMMSGLNLEGVEEVDGDIVIDLEVTSNRPDCLGHIGVAREIAVLFGHELKIPPTPFSETGSATADSTSVTIDDSAASWCPQYRARVIRNVKIGPSPSWMKRRLNAVGINSVNNAVDITNYVMLEWGQPLHVFDYNKLAGGKIIVRAAKKDEPFHALNDKTYQLVPEMGVIADADRAVALAGVMGGKLSEVDEGTTTILLESAEFAPLMVRNTSRSLALPSPSSYRFERKVDPLGIAWASDRACHLLAELCGGEVETGALHEGQPLKNETVKIRWSALARVLGIDIPRADAKRILLGLGLQEKETWEDASTYLPPSYRRDLTREIDLVEEVGRVFGYDSVPDDRIIPLQVAPRTNTDRVLDKVRTLMCGSGYFEAVTPTLAEQLLSDAVLPWTDKDSLMVHHNDFKADNKLRRSIIPSLIRCLAFNQNKGNTGARLFEIATAFLPSDDASSLPNEWMVLSLVAEDDIRHVRGTVENLFQRLGIEPTFQPAKVHGLHPEQSAEYLLEGEKIAVIGALDPKTADAHNIRADAVAAEIRLDPLIAHAQLVPVVAPVPDQPAVERDLAVVVDEHVAWRDIESTVRGVAGEWLESLQFKDLYRGKQIPAGKKSLALGLTFRADRTLTGDEVDTLLQQQVVGTLKEKYQAELRA